jgi:ubiquinone/menaquinone biosynthesis C-methylase UbiE
MKFTNSYENTIRAEAYAKLEFSGTYYLAYRDLPAIIKNHIVGKKALDFGCGTGRSTRFLQNLGFKAIGVDISKDMISIAKRIDPKGHYLRISNGDFTQLTNQLYDLILSAFTFDNIPMNNKETLFRELANLLNNDGKIINLVSSPEMYTHEWTSFSTKDYPENKYAKTGDIVPIITTDIEDKRPCYDIFCTDKDYKNIYHKSGLKIKKTLKPIATGDEPYKWVNETQIAPWIIYLLEKS